jgi:hypothetical protein
VAPSGDDEWETKPMYGEYVATAVEFSRQQEVLGKAWDQFVPKADEYFVKSANELMAWAIATGVFSK